MDRFKKFTYFSLRQLGCAIAIASTSLQAQDPELTNYKSGISLEWLGEKGVDYQEEYLYFDKVISDRKIVYIKADTKILMKHNERNKAGTPGGSDSYESVGLDIGKIRYKVDGDQRWSVSPYSYQLYETAFSFAELDYGMFGDSGKQVVGSTGDNGKTLANANKLTRYHRGISDSAGDEWHTLTVLDDDSDYAGSVEYKASDGKIFYFIVNPKTPALTLRVSGTGQFYTTPPKKYFIPKIYEQTTFIDPGPSGQITFEINDINGNNVFYRVNGGNFVNAESKSITLDDTAFRDGENTLEYYYAGNAQYVRTRKIIKTAEYPSANEEHGDRLWVNANYWTKDVRARLTGERLWWLNEWRKNDTWSGRPSIRNNARKGLRVAFEKGAIANAISARVSGMSAKDTGDSISYADYAKMALFEAPSVIDPVGAELNTSNSPIPCREIIYRGYYDADPFFEAATAYDILIGYYRRDQGFKNGITPIQDYYIRDTLARWVYVSSLFDFAGYGDPMWDKFDSGGMWDTARKVGAAFIACMLPSYSTEYYGTCGLDGNTTTYKWTPFRDVGHTWKELFFDNNVPMTGFPNVDRRMGVVDYNIDSDGNFMDRAGYLGTDKMGHIIGIYYNLAKLFAPATKLPNLEKFQEKAPIGQVFGLKIISDSDRSPAQTVMAIWQNRWHSSFKSIAQPIMLAITGTTSDNSLSKQLARGGPLYVLWYNHNIPLPSPPDGDPSNLLMVNATSSP